MKRLNRLSTFFSTLSPRVYMLPGETRGGASSPTGSGSYSPSPLEEEEEEEEEDEEETEDSTDSVGGC